MGIGDASVLRCVIMLRCYDHVGVLGSCCGVGIMLMHDDYVGALGSCCCVKIMLVHMDHDGAL